jgi:pimeloyl-ACP methyl ester carboxylesterase
MESSLTVRTALRVREYGTAGPRVVVLHGGPGAPGYMAPVARGLSREFRVLEPLQRGSGSGPLTVGRHVSDLHEVVGSHFAGARVALVGHSWGAMLALAYAAAHPGFVTALVLVGCGTFDPVARDRFRATCDEHTDDGLRRRLERLPETVSDPDERLRAQGDLILPLYSYDLATEDLGVEACDARAHEETWQDMLWLQEEGVYPAAFSAIDAPAIMLHGAVDPHPGQMIRASLEPHLPQLEYREWERCGHYPWLERAVSDEFFQVLREWLARQPAARLPQRTF